MQCFTVVLLHMQSTTLLAAAVLHVHVSSFVYVESIAETDISCWCGGLSQNLCFMSMTCLTQAFALQLQRADAICTE